jgi:hypothetical protein
MVGCEYFRWLCPNTDGCDNVNNSACLVASVMESVDMDVTELCRPLPAMEDPDMLGLSELKLETEGGKKLFCGLCNISCGDWRCCIIACGKYASLVGVGSCSVLGAIVL